MVVLQRNEVSRNRAIYFLTIVFSVVVIVGAALRFQAASDAAQIGLVLFVAAAFVAIALCVVQLYAFPKRSQVLLIQSDDAIVIAIHALHEGFKLRFLRDILGDNVTAFRDDERERWKMLEADGFYATLYIRNVRKLIIMRLCTMIFDDVFYADRSNRWEHHDSSSTAEPSFSKREMPRLTGWKSST